MREHNDSKYSISDSKCTRGSINCGVLTESFITFYYYFYTVLMKYVGNKCNSGYLYSC